MKFNAGDKVRIKGIQWYNENKNGNGEVITAQGSTFYKRMARFCGDSRVIKAVYGTFYRLENDSFDDNWNDDMIEGKFKAPKTQEEINNYLSEIPIKDANNLLGIEKRLEDDNLMLPESILINKSSGISSSEFIEWYKCSTSENCCDISGQKPEILQSNKEEILEELGDKAMAPDLKGQDYSGKRFGYKIPNGYEFDCIQNNEIIIKPIKTQYPKTYEECCKVLGCKADYFFTDFSFDNCDVEISDYEDKVDDLLQIFRKLRYCRDAYWKIAGEQMGLGKPWESDWTNDETKFVIGVSENEIIKCYNTIAQYILAFPTEEMRDAFYENFKELIEICKELL